MSWLSRLFSRQPAQQAGPRPAAAAVSTATAPQAPGDDTLPLQPQALVPWLLSVQDELPAALQPGEAQALAVLDEILAQPKLPPGLLPRAAAVVPQLIAMLRQEDLPIPALAQRIGKDPAIAAEVLRLATSSYYQAQGPVNDLAQAIMRLGNAGLQSAIARVVLRPLYSAQAGKLSTRVAGRLWDHSDALSGHVAVAAQQAGLGAFDGFLAGLLHDSGWTVLFHALDRAGQDLAPVPSAEAVAQLDLRAHRLFGLAAGQWDITPGFAALAADARRVPLATSTLPLAQALRASQHRALLDLQAGAR